MRLVIYLGKGNWLFKNMLYLYAILYDEKFPSELYKPWVSD